MYLYTKHWEDKEFMRAQLAGNFLLLSLHLSHLGLGGHWLTLCTIHPWRQLPRHTNDSLGDAVYCNRWSWHLSVCLSIDNCQYPYCVKMNTVEHRIGLVCGKKAYNAQRNDGTIRYHYVHTIHTGMEPIYYLQPSQLLPFRDAAWCTTEPVQSVRQVHIEPNYINFITFFSNANNTDLGYFLHLGQ